MKTKTLMMTGLLSMISAAAFAQTPVAQVHQDNAQIRQDTKQIHQDTREIKRDNAVIAAGAVVTRSVPANTIVAGNPAVVVKELS